MIREIKGKEGLSKKPKAARMSAEPVSPENDFPEATPCAVADGGDETCETAQPVQAQPVQAQPVQAQPDKRRCECCGAALSMYNADSLCWPCDKAIAEWKNFSMNRSELEQSMSGHCLEYVAEKFAGRKKVSGAVGGEVSSGSWARATGRKTLQRK